VSDADHADHETVVEHLVEVDVAPDGCGLEAVTRAVTRWASTLGAPDQEVSAMTITIDRTETTTTDPTAAPSAQFLLAVLQDTVAAVAHVDPDVLGSRHPAGQELLRLAALARAVTVGLGRHPGTVVTEAPGVVVVRELVAATRTLAGAIQ